MNPPKEGMLGNFDWQLSLALSSNKLANVNEMLAKVELELQQPKTTNKFLIEMNSKEIEILVQALEDANQALDTAK